MTKIEATAEKVAQSTLLTAVSRISITIAVAAGIPAGMWIVDTTESNSQSIFGLQLTVAGQERRLSNMEQTIDNRMNSRLSDLDRAAARLDERAKALEVLVNSMIAARPQSGGPR